MTGQYTNEEFLAMYDKAGIGRRGINPLTKRAWICYGRYTVNYYVQHEDGSWTNYDCKTKG